MKFKEKNRRNIIFEVISEVLQSISEVKYLERLNYAKKICDRGEVSLVLDPHPNSIYSLVVSSDTQFISRNTLLKIIEVFKKNTSPSR